MKIRVIKLLIIYLILNIYIYIYCGAEGCGNPSPFHIKPKAHVEEEEMPEDKQRRSKLLGDVAKDHPVIGKLRS